MEDREALAALRRLSGSLGPSILESIVAAGRSVPARWRDLAPGSALLNLRYQLNISQQELGRRAGVPQSQVSRLEGGADALLSTWRKVYAPLGFTAVLLPIPLLDPEGLRRRAEDGRPGVRQHARPRRRASDSEG